MQGEVWIRVPATAGQHPCRRSHERPRVVNVASAGQSPVDFDDVMLERG